MTRAAIPLADAPMLGGLARRTTVVRWALAAVLAAVAIAAVLQTRTMRVGESAFFSPGSAGVIVLDLSSSTEAAPPEEISLALKRIARSGRRAGLVLFSDVAYEALPPAAKAVELKPFIRYFQPPPGFQPGAFVPQVRFPRRQANPWSSFRGGTRISGGLQLARSLLGRHDARGVVLISDLNDSLFDLPQLTRVLHDYVRDRVRLRVVALQATPDDRAFWVRQLGEGAFVPEPALAPDTARHETRLVGAFPHGLVWLGVLLALGLAANELWGCRLSWSAA